MKPLISHTRIVVVTAVAFALSAVADRAATITWTNAVSSTWNNTANWSPNTVPGAADVAVITNAGVTVTLDISPTIAGLILGTNGAGTVTLSLNGQTLSLNGPFTVNPSGAFTVDSGAFVGNTNAVLRGIIGWTAGYVEGNWTLASGSTLNITTGNDHNMPNCVFTNNGTVNWSAGRIRGGSGGTVICNNGLWDCQADLTFNNDYSSNGTVFNNSGTFRKSGSSGSGSIFTAGVVLFNTGNFDVRTNAVYLQGGGTFAGGTATNLVGGVVLNAGLFNLNGTLLCTNVQLNGGTLTGTNVLTGGLNWIFGNWNSAPLVTVPAGSTLLVTSGSDHDMANVTLTNNGTVAWISGRIRGGSAGTTVYNNGLWDAQGDLTFNDDYSGNGTVFYNNGTFRKSASAGSPTYFTGGVLFNNTGKLDVQTNSVVLQGSGNFTGGTVTNLAGTVVLSIGNFNINGAIICTNVQLNGGLLVGTNVLTGGLNWIYGNWNSAANVTIPAGSVVLVTSTADHDMANVTLNNNGTLAWISGRLRGGSTGTTINNYGLWDSQDDLTLNDDYGGNGTVFNNYATFRKSGGTNTSQTLIGSGVFFNQLSGAIDVQTGNFVLQGGANLWGGTATNNNGVLWLSAGNFNLAGTRTGTNVIENAGSLVASNVINGSLNWQVGSWQFATSVTITTNSTVYLAGGSGNMLFYNCNITNYGTFIWNSGYPDGGGTPGSFIYNYGLWDCQGDYNLKDDGGGNNTTFYNYGTFRKSGGTNISQTLVQNGVYFVQSSGTVDVRTGNLTLQGGGSFTGGTVPNNTGLLWFSYGNFILAGTVTGTNVIENAGSLVGTNTINGYLTWQAGSWQSATSVTITTNSTVLLAGGGGNMLFYNCSITNYGTFAWNSGYPDGGGTPGSYIYNYGLWDCQGDYNLKNDAGGVGTFFNNYGTFRKSGGTNASQTLLQGGVYFNQVSGVVDVQVGNFVMSGGGSLTGGYFTTNSGALSWLSSGNFNVNGTVTTTNVIENPGSLVGDNVLRGGLTWQGGSWQSANSVTVATNSTLIIAGGNGNLLCYNCSITNSGTVAWSSGYPDGGGTPGTQIYNYGLWDCQGDYNIRNDAGGLGTIINNYGTFRKSAGSDASATTLLGGVSITNFGTLDAEAGWLSFQGGYMLTNGLMNFGINSLTNYGKISLAGAASLTGTVGASLNNGYIPVSGNSFTNLYYGSFTGLFTNSILPFADAWQTNYFSTYFVLNVLNARPVFAAPPTNNFVVNELTALAVTNSATDLDIPAQTLVYSLVNGVPGMTVNSANGILTWTPPQTNSPSTNIVSVAVTDNGTPVLSATNTFTVIVKEVNVPPSLPTIAPQIVNELTLLTVTNTATNFNIHSTITGYALVSPPSGMTISAGGVITWTPTQVQSPATNLITTIVTNSNPYDLINPRLTSTNQFTVIVREINVAPSLPAPPTQIVNELTLLTVTNTATNFNIHSTITGYTLVSPPAGMTISAAGIITWTPAQTQSPATNLITTIVTNSNPYDLVNPRLTSTNSFTVVVKEVNVAPSLPTIATQIVNELTLLTVTNTATNANIHSTITGYALVNPLSGMAINASGIFTWTPTQAQSPGTNLVTTIVTNSNPYDVTNPTLKSTNTFTVVVKEVNVAPSLPTIVTQIVNELTLLTVTNTATNSNIHSAITGYALVSPPSNMVINASGVITWTPAQAQSPSTNLITTIVTNSNPYDLTNPKLTSTNTFTVVVKEVNQAPTLGVIGTQTLTVLQPFVIGNSAGEPNIHSTTAGYLLVSPPAGASISSSGLITWTPTASQTLTTNTITTIVTNSNPYDLVNPHLSATNSFTAIVLPNLVRTNLVTAKIAGNFDITWPADHTGWRLQMQTNSLGKGLGTNWAPVSGSVATNHLVIPMVSTNGSVFFRMIYP